MSVPPDGYLQPGQRLDRYELLCPLAQGGMAQVWVARLQGKRGFQKLVAIKTILAQHARDPQFQAMFLNEARLIASIKHPHVAEIFDLGEERDVLYFVLELIEGDSLSALRRVIHGKRERFPLNVALRVASEACAGLHAAHELCDDNGEPLGVVHRDVSPANVLISTSGVSQLIDFGVAKALHRLGEETASGVIKGKVSYMAPEQAAGQAVDRRADIWAIGAVLYHLLAGRAPYVGENQLQVLNQLTSGRDPPPIPSIPPRVSAVIARALRREPAMRYATAEEMQRELEAALAEACGPTTSADVAQVVKAHLSDRVEARRHTIRRALEGAAAHARLAAELTEAANEPSDASVAGPGMTPPDGLDPGPPASVPGRASLSEGTLGNSTIAVHVERARYRVRLALIGVAATAALAAAILVYMGSRREEPKPAAAAAGSVQGTAPAPVESRTEAAATAAAPTSSSSASGASSSAAPSPSASATGLPKPPATAGRRESTSKKKPGVLEVFDTRK